MNQTEIRIRCDYEDLENDRPVDGTIAADQACEVIGNLESAIGDGLLTVPKGWLGVGTWSATFQVIDTDTGRAYTGPEPHSATEARRDLADICGIETRREAVVSTAHLQESTAQTLESIAPNGAINPDIPDLFLIAAANEYSITVRPIGDDPARAVTDDMPELKKLLGTLCGQYGFDAICFDRDAETLEGFETFDW